MIVSCLLQALGFICNNAYNLITEELCLRQDWKLVRVVTGVLLSFIDVNSSDLHHRCNFTISTVRMCCPLLNFAVTTRVFRALEKSTYSSGKNRQFFAQDTSKEYSSTTNQLRSQENRTRIGGLRATSRIFK
jgi:hypothetical protein